MESILKYNLWPKYDGEKWSRKNYLEVPTCGKMVMFIAEFVILDTSDVRKNSLSHGGISKRFFLDHFLPSF